MTIVRGHRQTTRNFAWSCALRRNQTTFETSCMYVCMYVYMYVINMREWIVFCCVLVMCNRVLHCQDILCYKWISVLCKNSIYPTNAHCLLCKTLHRFASIYFGLLWPIALGHTLMCSKICYMVWEVKHDWHWHCCLLICDIMVGMQRRFGGTYYLHVYGKLS